MSGTDLPLPFLQGSGLEMWGKDQKGGEIPAWLGGKASMKCDCFLSVTTYKNCLKDYLTIPFSSLVLYRTGHF